jgi:fructoselysine-6-P-deglycase FrlB-like protein
MVGAGDSYAAALCAAYLSRPDCVVLDPYELIASPELARSRNVVVVSVSGRTRSNVAAARSVEGIAEETIAVTANEASPLASVVDRTIPLPLVYRPRWPGISSYSLSLAYCCKLLSVELGVNFQRASAAGKKLSRGLRFSRRGSTFFLGNRALFAVSIYAAAKVYEFFGAKAQYQRLEEFSHMELFSLKAGDAVNVIGGSDPLRIGRSLVKSLRAAGYDSGIAAAERANEIESVFNGVFAVQFAVARWIRETGTKRPYILDAGKKLATSDSMIY